LAEKARDEKDVDSACYNLNEVEEENKRPPIEIAIDAFMEKLPEMLGKHEGQFVIFGPEGGEPLGFWHGLKDAYSAGLIKHGIRGTFLIRQVSREFQQYGRYGKPVEITRDLL
jgi:hypothetical protein